MKEIKLTKRGQAVANKKADSNKQWYERYLSTEYFEQKEFNERLIAEIKNATDESNSLFVPVYEISTLKKDSAIQRGLIMKMVYAKKYAEKLMQVS